MNGRDEINRQDGKGRTPLYLATRRLDFDAIETLLDAGADPRIADRWEGRPSGSQNARVSTSSERNSRTSASASGFAKKQQSLPQASLSAGGFDLTPTTRLPTPCLPTEGMDSHSC